MRIGGGEVEWRECLGFSESKWHATSGRDARGPRILECGDLSPLLYSATCRSRRLGSASRDCIGCRGRGLSLE
jgi:hypothetical protein